MSVDATTGPNAAATGVTGAIRNAAGATGAHFEYLLATAQIESGLNPNVKASTSSATGLFQFIDQTWLATVKDAGPSLGYGKYADAISRSKSGRMFVRDPAMRAEIMKLRKDPSANALMAGAFTKSNEARLTTKIGREPTDGELYMAHFLGVGGASKLIAANADRPGATAASVFPRAAAANRSIFYDTQGQARTIAQVYARLDDKLSVARAKFAPASPSATAEAVTAVTQPAAAPTATVTPIPRSPVAVASRAAVLIQNIAPMLAARAAFQSIAPATPAIAPMTPVAASASAGFATPSPAPATAATEAPAAAASAPIAPVRVAEATSFRSETPPAPVFHGLFHDEGRGAVSSTVSELWGPRASAPLTDPTPVAAAVPASASVAVTPPNASAPLDLLQFMRPDRLGNRGVL